MDTLFAILLCLLGALAVSLILHRIDAKTQRFRPLDPLIDGLPLGTTASGYLLFVALTGRPGLAMALMWGGAGLLDILNRLKLRFFREPILFLDITLASQVIHYPRFYVPYLFPPSVFWAGGLAVAALAGLWIGATPVWIGWRIACALALVGLTVVAWYRLGRLFLPRHRQAALALLDQVQPSFIPLQDFRHLGVLGAAYVHALWHVQARSRDGRPGIPSLSQARRTTRLSQPAADAPHLVLVQAESFCDIRRHIPGLSADILRETDKLRVHGQTGQLLVPTHGAYTMRTEFSVLTGLAPGQLGSDAFNPYWTAARTRVWSLAWALREAGYRTLCLHPFHPTFFERHRVMPNLGFDAFHSLAAFAQAPHCGPYVCDAALGQTILEQVLASRQPLFVFAITIEAHGPWKGDRFGPVPDATDLPQGERATYLWHLRHMDSLFGALSRGVGALARPTVLAGYGDHIPCLAGVGDPRLPDPTATDWFVWRSDARQARTPHKLRPEQLYDTLWRTIAAMD